MCSEMAATSDDMQMQPLDLSCPRRVQVTYSLNHFTIVTLKKHCISANQLNFKFYLILLVKIVNIDKSNVQTKVTIVKCFMKPVPCAVLL